MTKFIIDVERKGWFKGLGLHHASITIAAIAIAHFVGAGEAVSLIMGGWYARHEYGYGPKPPAKFEVMDFLSPVFVIICYNYFL